MYEFTTPTQALVDLSKCGVLQPDSSNQVKSSKLHVPARNDAKKHEASSNAKTQESHAAVKL
jgi:hypothetical protein